MALQQSLCLWAYRPSSPSCAGQSSVWRPPPPPPRPRPWSVSITARHSPYSSVLIARVQPFIIGVYSDTTTAQDLTGFNLHYTQVLVDRPSQFNIQITFFSSPADLSLSLISGERRIQTNWTSQTLSIKQITSDKLSCQNKAQ